MADINEGQFLEFEKRFAAFKHVFNTLQTTVHKPASLEIFETSHQVYLSDLINSNVRISANSDPGNDALIQPAQTRGWTLNESAVDTFGTGGSLNILKCALGSPADPVTTEYTTNPHVEKITMPLIKAADTNQQAYFCFAATQDMVDGFLFSNNAYYTNPDTSKDIDQTELPYNWEISQASIFTNPQLRVRNWIAPTRYGDDYVVRIYGSNADKSGPDTSTTVNLDVALANDDKENGGWAFDYYQGMLYMAPHPTRGYVNSEGNNAPYLPGIRHPLWIEGYRYIGPTGSNMTVTSAGSAGSAGSGGGGVSTTLTSLPAGFPGAYDTNELGWYDEHTFSATDSDDIIEYISDGNIVVSASFGDRDLVVRLDSSSYNNITTDTWPTYDEDNGANYNGADLFRFTGEVSPDFSSYGLFEKTVSIDEPATSGWVTQSFEFASATRLDRIGLCYSNNNVATAHANFTPVRTYYPTAFKLEASADNITFTEIAFTDGIAENTFAGNAQGPILNDASDSERINGGYYGTNLNSQYWGDVEGEATIDPINIYCATASISNTTRYQYYRLYVSGGAVESLPEDSVNSHTAVMALHHVDLWQNLDFGPTNRKQLNVKFNDQLTGQTTPFGEELTVAEQFVSASMTKIGFSHFVPAEVTVFTEGNIPGDVTFGQNIDFTTGGGSITGVTNITASVISASNKIIVGDLEAGTISGQLGDVTFGDINSTGNISAGGALTATSLNLIETLQLESNIIVPSEKSIFLTNKRQDGSAGVDEFSARIFGHYTSGNVSDMYLDAYRIYNVADAEVNIRTLHPTLGRIVLQSPITFVSGTLHTSQSILAGSITASHGMKVSGSILISGSIIPNVGPGTLTSSFDLGSSAAAWRDLHISDGTIRFYDGTDEKINMSIDDINRVQFKSGDEFQTVRTGKIELVPSGSTISNVQLSDQTDVGFIAVSSKAGQHATIFRAENQDLGFLGRNYVAGSITQKGSGSFAILLDADNTNHNLAKFTVESNMAVAGAATRLFSVSESFETRVHQGGLRADKYITTANITASIISASATITANSFVGTFVGAVSSSAQMANNISGSFTNISSSFDGRLTVVESELNNTLVSGSRQIATEISGAFNLVSSSLQNRITETEAELNKPLISGSAQIATEISGAFVNISSSLSDRISYINEIQNTLTSTSSFNALSASVQLKSDNVVVQSIVDVTGSFAVTNSNVTFNEISASNISASNLHTNIFNPVTIDTTTITASLSNLGTVTNTRTFTTDDHNTLLAADARPALTVRNAGGGDITYFGSPVDNADAFIKFQTDRSNTKFSVGVDSHDSAFKITEAETLNENNAGSTGFPTFKIIDNKVGIVKSTVSYTLDVGGDIRSSGVMRVDTIRPQTYGAFGTPLPYNSLTLSASVTASGDIIASGTVSATSFVGDGTSLTGIATIGNVVANSATASFLTNASAIDGGSF